jgi:hypothetical protein
LDIDSQPEQSVANAAINNERPALLFVLVIIQRL